MASRGTPSSSITFVIPSTNFFLFSSLIPAQTETCTTGNSYTPFKVVRFRLLTISKFPPKKEKFEEKSLFNNGLA
jgi:hypothetical protein